ncbi:MAG: hypothetical protein AAGA90_08615 [Actinomycetota bacterium]
MALATDVEDTGSTASPSTDGRVRRLALIAYVAGGLLFVVAAPLADLVEAMLPTRAEVTSRGTYFLPFTAVGDVVIRRTGAVLAAGGIAMLVVDRASWNAPDVGVRGRRAIAIGIAAVGAAWYGWLAHPHNGFLDNSRIHWVDFLTDRRDDFFYAAGRIPHEVFYDAPFLWQALNVAWVITLSWAIARRLGLSLAATVAMAATPIVATNLWVFADTAEDVMLNVALLLTVLWAVLRRGPVVVGVALTMAVLGRPSFLVLIPCVAAAEGLTMLRRERSIHATLAVATSRYVLVSGTVAVAGIVVSQLVMELIGDRYWFADGRVIDTGPLQDAEVVEVDGFSISAFSGAYVGHLLWVMPLVFVVGAVFAVVRAPRLRPEIEHLTHFGALGAVAVLLAHESQPLLYYNIRYLTYVWPFLFVLAWVGYLALREAGAVPAVRAAALVMLVAGTMVLPTDPVERKRLIEARPEVELLEIRDDLRAVADGGTIAFTFGIESTPNYVAYVMKSERWDVWGDLDAVDEGWMVMSLRSDPWIERTPDLETESMLVHVVRSDDLDG